MLQDLALSKLVTPLKRLLPMRMSLIKSLLKGRLQSRLALQPGTASAFMDGPPLQVRSTRHSPIKFNDRHRHDCLRFLPIPTCSIIGQ